MNESENMQKCQICNAECEAYPDSKYDKIFCVCPVCGRYELTLEFSKSKVNLNHLAAYLCHNRFEEKPYEYHYYTFMDKELCDTYREASDNNKPHGLPVHIDAEIVENWYPKSFSERVDKILLYLSSQTKHVGQQVLLSYQEALSAFFIDRKEPKEDSVHCSEWVERDSKDCQNELLYLLNYLESSSFVYRQPLGYRPDKSIIISLEPNGYARVDELQKNTTVHGKNAFVAMQFGNETAALREAIRKGITDAGYIAIFIDEVQHNDFITPEILKHIRDSKFVVVDLTHKNNGAYFEEGYAMGLGKTVIQLCSTETQLHFDIAQKNTIMWEIEDDIPEKLKNRIRATID